MNSILGYNFCSDRNCLDVSPVQISNIDSITIKNGIFDHLNMTKDVTSPHSSEIPTTWDYNTLMDAGFNGHLNAGNINFGLTGLSGFKVKRRKITDFEWINLGFVPVTNLEQLQFSFQDNLAASLQEYEWAFVPVLSGVEGNYITNTLTTQFHGVYICDQDTIYRFYAGVQYTGVEQVQKVGVHEPFGRTYPIVVSNAKTNYQKGSVNGTVLDSNFTTDRKIDRQALAKEREALLKFLTNKKAKVLKDWNGNAWVIKPIGSPSTTYDNTFGMGIASVGFDYVEVGDINSQTDLYNVGLSKNEV